MEAQVLGFAKVDKGEAQVQVYDPSTGAREDLPMFGALGVTALPYPPAMDSDEDKSGEWAEGLVTDVDGYKGAVIAYRDRRNAAIVGNLKPGDTAAHTTGPGKKAQLQLKQSGLAALMCKDSKGKDMALIMDGNGDSVSLTAFGHHITLSRDGGIVLGEKNGGTGITITKDYVHIRGTVILGGMAPNAAQSIMLGPPTGSPGGPASVPLMPAMGVFIGQ